MTTAPTESTTTNEVTAPRHSLASDDPVPVPDGLMACQGCGVAVPRPASPAQVVRVPVVKAYSPAGRPHGEALVALGMCPKCGDRAHAAVALAAAHPALVAALGQHRAVEAAEGILTALDILGVKAPTNDISDKRLGILVRNLSTVGLGIRWRTHIAAAHLADAANPHPWAHVRATDRMRLRSAYAAALAERVLLTSGPVKVSPPALTDEHVPDGQRPVGDGCGICGVDHVTVPAERAARVHRDRLATSVWTLHTSVAPESLGGRRSATRLTIWLCPACEDAYVWERVMGPSTVERALFACLGALGQMQPGTEVPGLTGWAGQYADSLRRGLPAPRPNAVPFEHIDLSEPTRLG